LTEIVLSQSANLELEAGSRSLIYEPLNLEI